jgi:hypothetical protein
MFGMVVLERVLASCLKVYVLMHPIDLYRTIRTVLTIIPTPIPLLIATLLHALTRSQ